MKKIFTWFKYLAKRQFKNPLILVLIILIPVTAIASTFFTGGKEADNVYAAGLTISGEETDYTREMVDALVNADTSIKFYEYADVDSMKEDILNEKIVSAYVIPGNLREIIQSGNAKGSITVYGLPASTLQASVSEIVYAELIKLQGYTIMDDYMKNSEVFPDGDYTKEAYSYYEYYLTSSETFHVDFETYGDGKTQAVDKVSSTLSFPIRNILAVMIFLSGLFGSVLFMRDKENGIFQTVTGHFVFHIKIMYIVIPVIAFSLSSLSALCVLGIADNIGKELLVLLIYSLAIIAFSLILMLITRKSRNLSACIPVLLLCCLVFCPVFIDLSKYVDAAKYIQKILLPAYYMNMF